MKHKGTQTLETERLILRQFTENDAEAAFRNWESDDKVTKFLRWQTYDDIREVKKVLRIWIENYKNNNFYQWAIMPKDLGEPIGTISAVGMDEKTNKIHIGYCIGSKWWHMGYTSEALARIIPFFFEEVGANRIESQHDPNNPNSGKVMQKCGMQYEGTLRQADYNNQGIVDACMYAILAEDYFRN